MKRILNYKAFESNMSNELTQEQTDWLNKCTKGTWNINQKTGEVDIDGNFNCSEQKLSNFKSVRFGEINGSFLCKRNSITSLEGSPREVNRIFSCDDNLLTSLKGAPEIVFYEFSCSGNLLKTLEHGPSLVDGNYSCDHNKLKSLIGIPNDFYNSIFCNNNNINSLDGVPLGANYIDFTYNDVSCITLKNIYEAMKRNKCDYIEAVSYTWNEIPNKDKSLLDLPFKDNIKWEKLGKYNKMKGLL